MVEPGILRFSAIQVSWTLLCDFLSKRVILVLVWWSPRMGKVRGENGVREVNPKTAKYFGHTTEWSIISLTIKYPK